jgi:hypothetical protein
MRSGSPRSLGVSVLGLSILLVLVVVSAALGSTPVSATEGLERPTFSGATETTTSATTNGIDVLLVGVAAAAILLWRRFRH